MTAFAQDVLRDTAADRAMIRRRLEAFDCALLAEDSATRALERWCEGHGVTPPARLVAEKTDEMFCAQPDDALLFLKPPEGERMRCRRVRLLCAGLVLSSAENWYVASRLTDGMNESLDTSDEPFGRVVAALAFTRVTARREWLWSWPFSDAPPTGRQIVAPAEILRHVATLFRSDGEPFSLVRETYTCEIPGVCASVRDA
ncbi:hypothetical protein AA23498_2586 [Acetobacter nitrogenifigens DSM 23921 = NBRC 105050]|uniref:Uncharacterized protein n=1 Tax=Acetobacter nitrogenifigens DSM 23921 = NBRC 105050 TaxID=1120919 RepID=A0A511X622_9PROT|nr:hypothetical protein [Acetobacter nitrogenifigens]GBQ96238.1 hypothetical protein AA23498_2586 [Acetobacter nitrogenifigens DSM 23921 = NBRC 105050]GEN58396.1 hypothetical protein ANI02nite_02800 [Acetobacter nitrogenifigens DSM 23921 = NBRC 105050]